MKNLSKILMLAVMLFYLTSCATIVGGKVTTFQKTKPEAGQPQREVKIGALLCDVIFWGGAGLIVDFATGAIYKDAPKEKK